MARKVVVPDADGGVKKKKKLNKCCTCLLVFGIVMLVIFGIAFGVGWYLGDKFTKENLDMSMGETMGVVNSLYWADDGKCVSNPYNEEADLELFYSEIKKNILLKDDVNIGASLDSALDEFVNKKMTSESRNSDGNSEGGASEGGDDSIMNVLVDMIADVYVRDNIDRDRLNKYSEDNDNYIFNLNDKQLAAFVNKILKAVLANSDSIEALNGISGMLDLKSIVSLKQIRFTAVSSTDEMGVSTIEATNAELTLWIGLQDGAGQALTGILEESGYGWAGGLARFLGNVILPKNLYATVSVPLYGDGKTDVSLNAMDQATHDNMYKLVNGVMRLTESDMTIDGLLSSVTEQITPYISKIADKMNFTSASSGTIQMDLIDALVQVAGSSMDGEGEPLTKADFMYMLQAVVGSDPDAQLNALEPYLYDGWYLDDSGKPTRTQTDKPVDYETELINELETKYALDIPTDDSGNKSLDSVLKMLGISLGGEGGGSAETADIMQCVRKDGLKSLIFDDSDIKLNITDRMLGAVVAAQLPDLIKSNATLANLSPKLDAVSFVSDPERKGHTYALVAVELDLAAALGGNGSGDSMISKLVGNLLGKTVVTLTVDVSEIANSMSPEQVDAVQIQINDFDNTDRVLGSIGKIAGDGFDIDSMTGEIGSMLTDMLEMIDDMFELEFKTYRADGEGDPVQGALTLPDVFTVVAELALKDGNGNEIMSGPELKKVLHMLYDNNVADTGKAPAANISGFTGEIADKYYLKGGANDDLTTFDGLAKFLSGTDALGNKFRVAASDDDPVGTDYAKYMAYDVRDAKDLAPVMTPEQLGALVNDKLGEMKDLKSFSLCGMDVQVVTTDGNRDPLLKIVMLADIAGLLPDNEMTNLIDINSMYVTAIVHTGVIDPVTDGYKVELKINNASDSDAEYELLMKLIKKFDTSFDIESMVSDIGKTLRDQMTDMSDSLGGDDFMTFTDKGLELKGFYDFLANKMNVNGTADSIKKAVQGMYARRDGIDNPNNYVANDFLFNLSTAETYNLDAQMAVATARVTQYINDNPGVLVNPGLFDPNAIEPITDTDFNFNGLFNQTVAQMAGKDESTGEYKETGVRAKQTIALSPDNLSQKAQDIRTWLNGHLKGSPIKAENSYLIVTFEMVMKSFMDGGSSSLGFLPDSIYATVAIECKLEAGKVVYSSVNNGDVVFNNMDAETYALLIDLMSLEAGEGATGQDTVNINTVVGDSVAKLNSDDVAGKFTLLFSALDEHSGKPGIGEITLVPDWNAIVRDVVSSLLP